jgi:hypothetical protein
MGWTFVNNYDGGGVRVFLDREFTSENDAGKWEIVKSALVQMRSYYAACRWTDKNAKTVRVFAMVVLVRFNPRDREGLTLGWKQMSEDMGPCADECPLAILDLLDCVEENSAAGEWRARVRAFHARRKNAPKPGDVIIFRQPLKFSDGSSGTRFRCERHGHRGRAWRNLETGGLCRISNIARRDYRLEAPERAP